MSEVADGPIAFVYDRGAASAGEIGAGLRRTGIPVVTVLGESEHARSMRPLVEEFGPVLSLDDGFAAVTEALRAAGTRGLTTFSERMQEPTALLAERLGLPYHSPATVRLLTDKVAQRERLREAGLPQARSHRVDDISRWSEAVARTGLPAVLKPVRGEGSRNTYLVRDADSGRESARNLLAGEESALVLEEFLVGRPEHPFGDYVSVECLVVDGEVGVLAVTGKPALVPPFREAGQFWPSHLPEAEVTALGKLAADAVRALGVRSGITHTEIKLTADGPRLIEVNGRLGGWVGELALRAAGVNLIEVAGRVALGLPVEVAPLPRFDGVYFQFSVPGPREACVLERRHGVADVRSVPGVGGVVPLVRRGERLSGGVQTERLDIGLGHAPDHAGMLAAVDKAVGLLSYTFTTDDGRTLRATAAGLRDSHV
ncbi:ATP-grasp domain-containing protein [Streptomyces sp. NPDC004539]|uniref:ATP-grasp domain-containing protein n=1 Tax=Streptomyces sp. NPDC004539 TaxID=3154280 RepID=UPI0033BEF9DB